MESFSSVKSNRGAFFEIFVPFSDYMNFSM